MMQLLISSTIWLQQVVHLRVTSPAVYYRPNGSCDVLDFPSKFRNDVKNIPTGMGAGSKCGLVWRDPPSLPPLPSLPFPFPPLPSPYK